MVNLTNTAGGMENFDEKQEPATLHSWIVRGWAALFVLLVIAVVTLAWVPPVSRDALTHHLAVPKLYLQHGGIYEIPEISFSYYPMNLDLLYLIPLYFGNDILPKYIHFAFALLTAGLVYGYLRKRLGLPYGLFGALFFLSIPVIVKLSVTVYVDLGLVFFSFAALLALFRWRQSGFRLRYLILAGVFCGLALGTKYNALVALLILTLMVPVIYLRQRGHIPVQGQWKGVAAAAAFVLAALVVFSPWMIRNVLWTGNPVYPLYRGFFDSVTKTVADIGEPAVDDEADIAPVGKRTGWNHIATRRLIYGESWWEIALLPVRIFFQGQDDNPKYFDGVLNPMLFLLPLLAFGLNRKDAADQRFENLLLLVFIVVFIALAFASRGIRIRYVAPVIPPLVVLSAFGFRSLIESVRPFVGVRSLRLAGAAVLVLALGLNAHYIVLQFGKVAPIDYIRGKIDRTGYITRYRPEYAVLHYANESLAPDAKILGMFIGNRRYYSDRPIRIHNDLLRNQAMAGHNPAEIAARLQKEGITHLVVGIDMFNRWGGRDLNDAQKMRLQQFFEQNTALLKAEGGYGLFALKPTAG